MPITIKIALHGTQVGPENDAHTSNNRRTKVPRGELVILTIPPEFVEGTITFDDASPFGPLPKDKVLEYPVSREIPVSAKTGLYPYTCKIVGKDGKPHSSAGGGEMEVGN